LTYLLYGLFLLILIFILSLIITVSIALLTLVERKVLSIIQRRVGPNHVGFKGRLQFIADAIKLLLKGINIPDLTNKKLFIFVPVVSLFICYTFWINSVWGSSIFISELEYNLVYASIMSIMFSICVILVGVFSRNKYSILSSVRSCCMVLNLEIFLGFFFLFVLAFSESFSFSSIINLQTYNFYFIQTVLPILPIIVISFLLETNRAPFDLTEAESELIAGYTTELGGFFFALFYLGEYFHLFFFSLVMSILLLGGYH
jgi:NADH-quinone oxidoreductase subunit H